MSLVTSLVREARPRQWTKNALVFAAPAALGVLDEAGPLGRAVALFLAFCATASGVYYWNDIRDVEQDRLHPTKKNRPIASGSVPMPLAKTLGTALLVSGLVVSYLVRAEAGYVMTLYVVLQVLYSGALKHVALLDLAIVSSGFVLRAMIGAVGTDTPMSNWFVLCITFGSFFIVTGKRYAELKELGDDALLTRVSMKGYTVSYLNQVMLVSVTATVVTYCMWALENADASSGILPLHGITIVPMVLALLRYLMLLEKGQGGAPEDVFLGDRVIQAYGLAWVVLYGLAVYSA